MISKRVDGCRSTWYRIHGLSTYTRRKHQTSPYHVCVLEVLPVLALWRASGHAVFTIASFLVMWRLRLESLPTIHGQA